MLSLCSPGTKRTCRRLSMREQTPAPHLQSKQLLMWLPCKTAMVPHQIHINSECFPDQQKCMRIKRECGVLPAKLKCLLAQGGFKGPALAPYNCVMCRATWCTCPNHCTADDCSADCSGEGGNLTSTFGGDQLQHCLANLTKLCFFS